MTKEEARKQCLEDPIFLAEQLGYDITEVPHRELFNALQSGKKKRLVLWPRGHYKTSAVVVFLVQCILRNPDIRILVMQATLTLTKGWVSEIKSHFDGTNRKSALPELFPKYCADKLGDAASFTCPARTRMHLKEATVTAASPNATKTGQHYDLMAFDDLVNDRNFRNVEQLDKLQSQYNHFLPLLDPGGEVIMTGTRYSHADLYAQLMKKDAGVEEWEKSVKECYLPDGSLLFPQRPSRDGKRMLGFTVELLASLQRGDPEMFAPQYLNKITLGSQQRFPEALVLGAVKSSKDPEYPAAAPCYFFIDLAESQKAGSDDRVIGIARQDVKGRVWLVDCLGSTWSVSQLTSITIQQALLHRPVKIWVEKQPGSEFFAEHVRVMARERGLNLPIEIVTGSRQKGAKEIRIESLETYLKAGKLFFCAGIHDFDKLVEEFTQFPRGRHDDRPDCIAHLAAQLAAYHFPQAPAALPGNTPWFVSAVLQQMADEETAPCRSVCGDGFV
jgi:predicted phage terminase large subunit-like protein